MIRATFHLARQQLQALQTLSKKTGLSVAELVRRAIDMLLRKDSQ